MVAPATVSQTPVSSAVSALERLERALHPARVDAIITEADDDDLRALYHQGKALYRLSWITQALVIGHAFERAERSEAHLPPHQRTTITAVAKGLGVHKSKISRQLKVYRNILRPRIDAHGEAALFVIDGRVYYELAIDASEFAGVDVFDVLAIAEDAITARGGYSLRAFKQELLDRGWIGREVGDAPAVQSLDDRAIELRAIVQRLSGMEDDTLEHVASAWLNDVHARQALGEAELILSTLLDRIAVLAAASTKEAATDEEEFDEEQ